MNKKVFPLGSVLHFWRKGTYDLSTIRSYLYNLIDNKGVQVSYLTPYIMDLMYEVGHEYISLSISRSKPSYTQIIFNTTKGKNVYASLMLGNTGNIRYISAQDYTVLDISTDIFSDILSIQDIKSNNTNIDFSTELYISSVLIEKGINIDVKSFLMLTSLLYRFIEKGIYVNKLVLSQESDKCEEFFLAIESLT